MSTQPRGTGDSKPVQLLEIDRPAATTAPAAPGKAPRRRIRPWQIILPLVLLLAGLAAGIYYFHDIAPYESTDDAYIDGQVISVNPQIPALVAAVHADDNQYVHKGDLLVELDPTDYQAALNQARGAEASAKGKLEEARAGVDAAQSAVAEARAEEDAAQAMLDNAELDLKRYQGLEAAARSQQDFDTATKNLNTATADVERAKARLQAATSQVESAKASVISADGDYQKAQADTHQAQVRLGYCRIVAATDGRITNKSVDPGDYVTSASTLFQIVPPSVWVVANFKETQLNDMRPGQPVTLTVDAYPHLELHGRVDSIQAGTGARFSVIPPENATGNFVKVVQRVPVKIVLDNQTDLDSGQVLAPGMSVEPSVRVR